jgi:methylated-DNA-[protein]-cysteine S-methyltransferase
MRGQVDQRISKLFEAPMREGHDPLFEVIKEQLLEYSKGLRKSFDLPLKMAGTDFQRQVWNQLLEIPFGRTASYLELSRAIGDENAIRAVATANGANALAIIVPCHRIIGSDGTLVGYAGGLATKKKLLQLEGALPQLDLFS